MDLELQLLKVRNKYSYPENNHLLKLLKDILKSTYCAESINESEYISILANMDSLEMKVASNSVVSNSELNDSVPSEYKSNEADNNQQFLPNTSEKLKNINNDFENYVFEKFQKRKGNSNKFKPLLGDLSSNPLGEIPSEYPNKTYTYNQMSKICII